MSLKSICILTARVMLVKHKLLHVTLLPRNLQWFPVSLRIKAKVLSVASNLSDLICFLLDHSDPDMLAVVVFDYPGMFMPQGLCTCYSLCLETSSPVVPLPSPCLCSLSSFCGDFNFLLKVRYCSHLPPGTP